MLLHYSERQLFSTTIQLIKMAELHLEMASQFLSILTHNAPLKHYSHLMFLHPRKDPPIQQAAKTLLIKIHPTPYPLAQMRIPVLGFV